MRTKVTLALVFLNVALFFFIFKFERNWRTESATAQARSRVLGPEVADIRSIDVTSSVPGGSFKLVRRRDAWFLTAPLDWPANPHAVGSIVSELQLLEHDAFFATKDLEKHGMTLAEYGLDSPKLTIAFGSGPEGTNHRTTLRIGDTTKVGNRLYVLSPDGERIHVVKRTLVDALTLPLDQLRADSLLTIPVFEARSLTVQTGSPDQTRAAASGLRTRIRREGNRWLFETPIIARASKLEMDTTINELNSLRPKTFGPTPPATLPSAAPLLRITVEGNNRHETLFLGERVTPPIAAPAGAVPAEAEYHAQLEGRSVLFTVTVATDLIEKLRNAQVRLRERRILDFETRAVTAITLAAPLQPNQPSITLQRLDAGNPESPWQILRLGEAGQGTATQPADPALVHRLLNQLTLLSARTFETDAPTSADLENWGFNRPEREVSLTLAGSSSPTVLRLGTDARQRDHLYARVGTPADPGTSVYSVDADILRELRVDPAAWRNRLVYELAATARITGIRLIDLSTNQPVFEAALDANGQPAKPVRDPAALRQVLAGLRRLQAGRFVRDQFPEKVTVAGEERPWRYRLEATVALPVAAGAEQKSTFSLFLTDRVGGAQQIAGSREIDAIFEIEQSLLDGIWALTYGPRDPGAPAPPKP